MSRARNWLYQAYPLLNDMKAEDWRRGADFRRRSGMRDHQGGPERPEYDELAHPRATASAVPTTTRELLLTAHLHARDPLDSSSPHATI